MTDRPHMVQKISRVLPLAALAASGWLLAGCDGDGESEKITRKVATIADATAAEAHGQAGDTARSYLPAVPARPEVIPGNSVELLIDGPETFERMFTAIANAQDHINLETFILADDAVGQRLARVLAEQVRRGLVVNLIYDAIGSGSTDESFFDNMRDSGINLLAYRPLLETAPGDWLNRNHRKVLIVDGRIGFAGGLNFTEEYRFSSDAPATETGFAKGWRDTHLKIEGPAVEELQREFVRVLHEVSEGAPVPEAEYFPGVGTAGRQDVAVVTAAGNDEDGSTILEHYRAAIDAARSRVWITQAYFAPTDELIDGLREAAARGVDVRLLLPRQSDVDMAVLAARARYDELLEAGVRIFEYTNGILHAKTALVDEQWSTVGSSNLDLLSIEYNKELNAVVLDPRFTQELAATFVDDLEEADEVTLAEWNDRSLWTKTKHGVADVVQSGM